MIALRLTWVLISPARARDDDDDDDDDDDAGGGGGGGGSGGGARPALKVAARTSPGAKGKSPDTSPSTPK